MNDIPLPLEDLKYTALFRGLGEEDLQLVLSAMTDRTFAPGEVVLRQGIVTQNVWLLLEGRCDVVKEPALGASGRTVTLAELGPYETFGEMSMFMEMPHCTSVWTKTEVRTIKLRRSDFEDLSQQHATAACQLACNLVNILSERLKRMDEWITELLDEPDTEEMHDQWLELRQRLQHTFPGYIV